MQQRAYAPGSRLSTAEELEDIIFQDAQYGATADTHGLSERHVQRICQGEHWREGWKPRRIPQDYKTCAVCGVRFGRRMSNGRLRAPKIWTRMVCCGNACNLKRAWSSGKFDGRGK